MGNAGYGNHTDNKDDKDTKRTDQQAERTDAPATKPGKEREAMPAAGPHDKPSLTNADATPGTGVLPEPGEKDATDSTGG